MSVVVIMIFFWSVTILWGFYVEFLGVLYGFYTGSVGFSMGSVGVL